jgi:hypothetical protein
VRKTVLSIAGIGCGLAAMLAQTPVPRAAQATSNPSRITDDSYLKWRLLPSEQRYAPIDGEHLKQFVNEHTAMSRRYRDKGHQFWGRIIGTEADAENAGWPIESFPKIGRSDVREQSLDCRRNGCLNPGVWRHRAAPRHWNSRVRNRPI